MADTLLSVFPNPNPDDLLALEPEDLAGILLEVVPGVMQNAMFNLNGLEAQLFHMTGSTYPVGVRRPVQLALAEALSWLVSQGLLLVDPNQPAHWLNDRPHSKVSGCKFLRTVQKSASICGHLGANARLRSLIHPSQGVTVLPCCRENVTRA